MEVSTNRFEASHGRRPRGVGLWMFEIAGVQISHNGSFTEARREAVKQARVIAKQMKLVAPVLQVMP